MKRITETYLLSKGFVFDSHGDYDLKLEDLGKLTINIHGYTAEIEDSNGEMCEVTSYPVIYQHQLEALLEAMTNGSVGNQEDGMIDSISDSHIAYKVIKRHPCCDKPTPKTITTPRGSGKKIGAYTQHTECAKCGKRW